MPSSFSPNLRIELIGDGEQAGAWGSTTNTNLGTLLESAISGYATVSVTSADQALTHANGATDQARNAMIELTTTTGADFAVYAPPTPKTYTIYNASAYTATIYNSTVLGNTTAAGAGLAVLPGETTMAFTDGDDFSGLTLPAGATEGEAQAGTNNTNFITPLRMRQGFNASGTAPVYATRAWVNFNGTGTVAIRASGNVSSITDNGTGDYTVNFTTAMSDANYAATTSGVGISPSTDAISGGTEQGPCVDTFTASSVRVTCGSNSGIYGDWPIICVSVSR
jgi:hypothetical protein